MPGYAAGSVDRNAVAALARSDHVVDSGANAATETWEPL
jgi:hypothetical protein